MKKWLNYIKLFWYFASNWNPVLAAFILSSEIKGENKYQINTSPPIELPDLTITNGDIKQSSRYEAVNYYILESLLKRLSEIVIPLSFTDLGCGKGRAMVVAAYYGFTKINGVDFGKEVCDSAKENMQKLVTLFPEMSYSVSCKNVLEYEIQPHESVFFMFNPFNHDTIFAFLENLEKSIEVNPRTIYFLYVSPKHIEIFFEFEYEPVFRKRKLKWLDGVILKKEPPHDGIA